MNPVDEPRMVITGCSSGIGLGTAILAAQRGYRVIATMRDLGRADALREAAQAAGVTVDVQQLDVTDEQSIARCMDEVIAAHQRIDVLVNNAGSAGTVPTIEQCAMSQYRRGFEVNFFGTVAVTKAAMPHLRASGGKIITVGSTRGIIAQPFNESYSAAKFATAGFFEALAPTAKSMGVSVTMVEPGPVLGTAFAANAGGSAESVTRQSGPYTPVLKSYLDWFGRTDHPDVQTADEIAEVILDTAHAPSPPFRVLTSPWAREFAARKLVDPSGGNVIAMTSAWLAPHGGAQP
ncbi:MAG TPA: SDR family oxidoreductase [Candidatus Stackebrandtia faecavium]|nr:SDR family oxidoreductase [Candidatus Stackebrandtia faecavium]